MLSLLGSFSLFGEKIQDTCSTSGPFRYIIKGSPGMKFYWQTDDSLGLVKFKGNIGVIQPSDTVWITWPSLAKPHGYSLSVTGELGGCKTVTKKLFINIRPGASAYIDSMVEFCKGDNYPLTVIGNYTNVLWQNNSTINTYIADSTQKVWVRVSNKFGCSASDTSYVKVNPLPVINLHKDTSLCFGNTLNLDAGNKGASYIWSDGSTNETFKVSEGDTTVWVKVTDAKNCINIDTFKLLPCPIAFDPDKIPAAFTPNNDGRNDTWLIPGIEQYPKAVIEVYDRWGRLVYRSKQGYGDPWDGSTTKGKVAMDAYFYIINLNTKGTNPITGSVTVIR